MPCPLVSRKHTYCLYASNSVWLYTELFSRLSKHAERRVPRIHVASCALKANQKQTAEVCTVNHQQSAGKLECFCLFMPLLPLNYCYVGHVFSELHSRYWLLLFLSVITQNSSSDLCVALATRLLHSHTTALRSHGDCNFSWCGFIARVLCEFGAHPPLIQFSGEPAECSFARTLCTRLQTGILVILNSENEQ